MRIGDKAIGAGAPCFVIAEAGVNHNGDVELAHQMIDMAADSGADAIKFQTFQADLLASPAAEKAAYQSALTDAGESQRDMLRRLELKASDFFDLKAHCERRGIIFLSTPFEDESVGVLDRLGVAAFKIPSGEVTNLPLLRLIAGKGRPIILSTGMADLAEVKAAVEAIQAVAPVPLALLQCTSLYPAEPAQCNLRAMKTMADAFGLPVGFSDHTVGITVPIAAAALGAAIIEKHFTLDRNMPGPDHKASLLQDELRAMIGGIREAEAALGDGVKKPLAEEGLTAAVVRKSVVAREDIAAGTAIDPSMIGIMRPGTGIAPVELSSLYGKRVRVTVPAGSPLTWENII